MRYIFCFFILSFFIFITSIDAFSFGFTCDCITVDWSGNVNRVSVCKSFATATARDAALTADRSEWSYHCDGSGTTASGTYRACADFSANGEFNVGVYAYCPSCFDANNDSICDPCPQQKQAKATECGGIDKVQCDVQCNCSCQSSSTCSSARIQAAQKCGGNDKYIIDQNTCEFACKGACENENLLAAIKCEGQGTYTINTDCSFYCNPSSYCAQAYEALSIRCGGSDQILDFDDSICTGVCTGCKQEYLAAKNSCSHPLQDPSGGCSFHCGCSQAMQAAESACPNGFRMDTNTCEYQCHDCATLAENCVTQCGGSDNISSFDCKQTTSSQGDVSFEGKPCVCKNDNRCSAFFSECDRRCSPANCGGVAVKQCYEAGGQITYSKCDCNGCNTSGGGDSGGSGDNAQPCADHAAACQAACSQEGCGGVKVSECSQDSSGSVVKKCECVSCGNKYIGDNNGNGNTPSNPSQPSDSNGWLSAIKDDLDNLVRHAEDEKNWRNSFQSSMSGKLDKLVDVTMQGNSAVVSAVADMKTSMNKSITIGGSNTQVVSEAVEGLGEGLSNVAIGTEASGDYSVSSGNYGSAPTDADLPTAEQSKSAFGTFNPGEGDAASGYRGQVKASLNQLAVTASGPVCSTEITLPWVDFHAQSIIWKQFPVDFCPYESYFALIGNVLVVCFGLRELYMFSS